MAKIMRIDPNLQKTAQAADNAAFGLSRALCGRTEAANQLLQASRIEAQRRRGRGAALNPKGRFEKLSAHPFDDGWGSPAPADSPVRRPSPPAASAEKTAEISAAEAASCAQGAGQESSVFAQEAEAEFRAAPSGKDLALKTEVQQERARKIITHNDSPDIGYETSINPYRGCEHGCIYCYARPSHSFLGLSAGLDFESRLFVKTNAAELLRQELAQPSYKPKLIALGSNTDPYQPIEKQYKITRAILEVLYEARHPVSITTKSALVVRDTDILAAMAKDRLAHITLSIETLDAKLARSMDPRAAAPQKRLGAAAHLIAAGIPVSIMAAPLIPALNDYEMENIMAEAARIGARGVHYTLLRLPYEVAPLFKDWLLREYPDKYRHVMSALRAMHGGADNESDSYIRLYGRGLMANLLARRFELARVKYGFNREKTRLSGRLFRVPQAWKMQSEMEFAAAGQRQRQADAPRRRNAPAAAAKPAQKDRAADKTPNAANCGQFSLFG